MLDGFKDFMEFLQPHATKELQAFTQVNQVLKYQQSAIGVAEAKLVALKNSHKIINCQLARSRKRLEEKKRELNLTQKTISILESF